MTHIGALVQKFQIILQKLHLNNFNLFLIKWCKAIEILNSYLDKYQKSISEISLKPKKQGYHPVKKISKFEVNKVLYHNRIKKKRLFFVKTEFVIRAIHTRLFKNKFLGCVPNKVIYNSSQYLFPLFNYIFLFS